MTTTGRRTFGIFMILALIGVVAMVVVSFANRIAQWPIWAQTLFYCAAGLVWLLPLKPLLIWMNKAETQ